MQYVLGIDLACRARHQASLADIDGRIVWHGWKFTSRPEELERLWAKIALGPGDDLLVVMEPTRNAWVLPKHWFASRGARVVLIPTTQSADLRAYLSKHTKNDKLDSQLLARLPSLHGEELREHHGAGPGDPLRRLVRRRDRKVAQHTQAKMRLDSLLELLGPGWHDALGSDFTKTGAKVLIRYSDPRALLRLGPARLTTFLARHSRGHWGRPHADALLAAARESVQMWGPEGIDYAELADSIAAEASDLLTLHDQIAALDARIAPHVQDADPGKVLTSVPGIGAATAAVIVAIIADPARFHSLDAVRAYSGLVPITSQSGSQASARGLTKAGDPLLRKMAFLAADTARQTDPQLARQYQRLRHSGRHHTSAICHLAGTLLVRAVACWRANSPYILKDTDGTPITTAQGRQIVNDRYQIDPDKTRGQTKNRKAQHHKKRTSRESQKSHSAPTSRPVPINPRSPALT